MTAVLVGQLRIDPDRRRGGRYVRVVAVGVPSWCGREGSDSALVEDLASGRHTRIALRRLGRWPLGHWCRADGCTRIATHGPDGEAVACWPHAGDWPEVTP